MLNMFPLHLNLKYQIWNVPGIWSPVTTSLFMCIDDIQRYPYLVSKVEIRSVGVGVGGMNQHFEISNTEFPYQLVNIKYKAPFEAVKECVYLTSCSSSYWKLKHRGLIVFIDALRKLFSPACSGWSKDLCNVFTADIHTHVLWSKSHTTLGQMWGGGGLWPLPLGRWRVEHSHSITITIATRP